MHTRTLVLALAAIALGGYASAQDDLPYHQKQRAVVIFKVESPLTVQRMDGTPVEVLGRGYYRYEVTTKSRLALTQANFDDQTGPFSRYPATTRGEIRGLFDNVVKSEATLRLKVTDLELSGRRNVIDAGEVEIAIRVNMDAMSSTVLRMKGPVARTGAFVPGDLAPMYQPWTGGIKVYHTFLSLENHLPQVQPAAFFPREITATASPTPTPSGEIEAGPYAFELDREAVDALGIQAYDGRAEFPMVHESDYYGDYVSSAHGGEVLVKENGDVYVSFGWSLSGRYHGWSRDYSATLTPAEFATLKTTGRVTVSGTADFNYAGEDDVFDVQSPCSIVLETAPATVGLTGGLGN